MSRRSGFTLIELLVVIAIIAILAAILFPVFSAAKASAQKSNCQNNVKEILQAALMYEDDSSGGILPGAVDYNNSGSSWDNAGDELWCKMVDKYIRQLKKTTVGNTTTTDMRGVFLCPSAPPVIPTNGGSAQEYLARPYGYNYYYLGGNPNSGTTTNWHKCSEVVKTTTTVRILENWNFQSSAGYRRGLGSMMCYPPYVGATYCTPDVVWPPGWHSGTSTVGWFDGHVSAIKAVPPHSPASTAYTGVMTKTLNGANDPYFRLAQPKP